MDLRAHTLLLTVAGSRAHGVATPTSDIDLRGCAFPTRAQLLGFRGDFQQADGPGDMDPFAVDLNADERTVAESSKLEGTVYSLQKFAKLSADANPNLLEVLFCRDAEVRHITPAGERLRAARDAFLSQRALHRFTGYAHRQLHRIRGHRAWLLDPPKAPPTRAAFDLPERTLLPKDQLAAAEAEVQRQLDQWNPDWGDLPASEVERLTAAWTETWTTVRAAGESRWHRAARAIGLDDNLMAVMDRERRYRSAQKHWEQYRHWRTHRNPSRAALEAAHGYDTKHGMHLVRLLRMGREILTTGQVHVWRGGIDRDELRGIRAGAWTYERLVDWADGEAAALRALVSLGQSVLPAHPDLDALDALVVALTEGWLSEGGPPA